ncbi:MAG: histidine kinase N-terminal 7TM domain-containing protein, partial [Nitrososphaera sp.]
MMTFFAISGLLNGLTSFGLGLFVLLTNRRRPLNQIYFLFTLSVAIWGWGYFFWPISETKSAALNSFRLLHFGAVFVPICYYHFVLVLTGLLERRKTSIFIGYLLAIVFACSIPTRLYIYDMVPKFIFKFWAVPGVLYHFYLLYFFAYVMLAVSNLWREA